MKRTISKHWPLIMGIAVLWLTVGVLFILSTKQNDGHLAYALDDSYIHMAIAKNFSQHGVWGVTRYEFTSSSSSLFWTLLLSVVYLVFGVHEASPLILNITSATLIVLLVYWILSKHSSPFGLLYIFLILLGMIFATPLPALIFTGQEHTLHALITIFFVYLSAKALSEEAFRSLAFDSVLLLVVAPVLTLIRYEGLFLVLVVCTLFILRKRWAYSLSLGALAIVPIGVYGIISVAHGWFWLPNSVLLKGTLPDLTSAKAIITLVYSRYLQLLATPHILFIVIAALILYVFRFKKEKGIWEHGQIMVVVFIATTLLHLQFARTGWFYRYEAYLVGLGIFVVGTSLREYLPQELQIEIDSKSLLRYAGLAFLIFLIVSPFVVRGTISVSEIPQATTNTYEQQYQIGLFVREFYQGQAVAATDIGAINYLADIKCLDLVGLGNVEVARAKRGGYYDGQHISELAESEHVGIAVGYDYLFKRDETKETQSQWTKVGQWKILNNVVCGQNAVVFYAVDPSEVDGLIENLRTFSSQLPKGVVQTGEYTK